MGDTNMCTDNPVLLRNTENAPAIICIQKKSEKIIPTEGDIITANKLGFNDDIGVVTNYVTSMIERRAAYKESDPEYKTLKYRIMCGQMYQQNVIDRIKGVVAKPMPSYWYNIHDCKIQESDDEETIKQKKFNEKIAANRKPYFMTYVYPQLKTKYRQYIRDNDLGAIRRFQQYGINSLDDLRSYNPKTQAMDEYLDYFKKNLPTGNNTCVVNRMCWLAEKEFNTFSNQKLKLPAFDYSILKSNVGYSQRTYDKVTAIYKNYRVKMDNFLKQMKTEKVDPDYMGIKKKMFADTFRADCEKVCTNDDELCDIVIDLCYSKENTKQFAWDICGETILRNLACKNDNMLSYPVEVQGNGEFTFCGKHFEIHKRMMGGDKD